MVDHVMKDTKEIRPVLNFIESGKKKMHKVGMFFYL